MWNACHGFMAIWSDVAPSDLDFYHRWLLKEHFPERVGIPGFTSARVFRRQAGPDFQFFIIYETESPEVLASPAYVARLNNPTPMTQKVMPKLSHYVALDPRRFYAAAFLPPLPRRFIERKLNSRYGLKWVHPHFECGAFDHSGRGLS